MLFQDKVKRLLMVMETLILKLKERQGTQVDSLLRLVITIKVVQLHIQITNLVRMKCHLTLLSKNNNHLL